jgi:hypothetical protein
VPDYVTIEGVELIGLGIGWPTAPESTDITLENLVDVVVAANDDPLIRPPRIKLGHARLQPGEQGFIDLGDFDPFWDGAPIFGTATNLRLNDHGSRVLGDFTEVPAWLADAIPSAWPARSCEWTGPVKTEGDRTYSFVLTAVSLLGERQHAIKNLADVRRLVESGSTD